MTIDSHQHFWNYDPAKDSWITDEMDVLKNNFTPRDLKPILNSNKIDGCVLVQVDQSEKENDSLLKLAEENDFIKGVVGWIDFQVESIQQRLAHYASFKKLKGFRHIVQGEPDDRFLLRTEFMRGISALQPYNFTYDILIYPRHLPVAIEFVKRFPSQKFVIDHLAKPEIKNGNIQAWKKDIQQIASFKNVYCKISGMVTEADWQKWNYTDMVPYLDVLFEYFGVDRLMYGSDWPVCLLAGSYEKQLTITTTYINSLSSPDQNKIMGENAVKFYSL
ncbi:MAG: amidohydrolase family protein [Cyclobacteriaceae bacterium]|nr:amidohydrolase family protein [Cyclobacteriaceae bacterium]